MNTVWELPFPSTGILEGPEFKNMGGRELRLTLSLQGEEETDEVNCGLQFSGAEAYKCTFLTSCNEGVIRSAYDKLTDCGTTEWLREVQDISDRVGIDKKSLHHYRIFFDEGPCYEVICEKVSPL